MKKILISALYAIAVLTSVSCAKHTSVGPNDGNKRYFDAWMQVNHPDAKPVGLGIYILEDKQGQGVEVGDAGYVNLNYKVTDLENNISAYTDKETAKQLGDYDTTSYYGPKFLTTAEGSNPAGLLEAIVGMKVGGYRKVIIPSWLMNYSVYKTEAEYLDPDDEDYNASSYSNAIYEFTISDYTENMGKWQEDQIGKYFKANTDIFGAMTPADSLPDHRGFYYKQLEAPTDTTSFKADTTLYINYTGRLLNGLVFDTSIEKVAKDNGLYSAGKSYKPVQINWGENYEDITMGSGSSSIISGFALTLWQMRSMEKGIGVFVSDYGYKSSGSGSSIPGFAPLIFEIELVAKPED
ncbi:MAG: FKBP-type peptidyl-prolyl cis-trans isomerase [Bacteroidales bacterium]|nr:FKBP-type peptidyl-prolyl cis-trans isomerase [Bacteroidales bacterium]